MSDKIELLIKGLKVKDFLSYSIDSDLLFSACSFELELANPKTPVEIGSPCKILVNGAMELNGQIEIVETDEDKENATLKVSGRDLMGILVDACCEISDCEALEGVTVLTAAKRLTQKLTRKFKPMNIIMQKGCEKLALPHGQLQIEPGMKIFDILSRYASMRALIFYSRADGTMVFGKPKFRRDPGDPKFSLVRKLKGSNNNIKSCRIVEDLTRSYSQVTVVSQSAGTMAFGGAGADAVKINAGFPSGIYKPLVVTQNGDLDSPSALARLTVEKMQREMLIIEYTAAGHGYNGVNWSINNFCNILDEKRGIRGDYLIYGRTFKMSKNEGTQTALRLGRGGLA